MRVRPFREHFPSLDDPYSLAHLGSCSLAPVSIEVRAAVEHYLRRCDEDGAPWGEFAPEVLYLKVLIARLIGAEATEIAIFHTTGAACMALGRLLAGGGRDALVTSALDFPQTQRSLAAPGLRAVTAPPRIEAWAACVDERTALVSAPLVAYDCGHRPDLERVARMAHEAGAYLFVDGDQGLGAVDVNVRDLGIDAMAAGCSKYLLGLPGVAFLYVSHALLQAGSARLEAARQDDPYATAPLPDEVTAEVVECDTPPVLPVYAARAGLALLLDSLDVVYPQVEAMARSLRAELIAAGHRVAPEADPRGPMVPVLLGDAVAAERRLRERGVVASARGAALRLSVHGFTNESDLARAVEALAEFRP